MKKSALVCIVAASIGWGTSDIFVDCLPPFGFTSLHMTFIRSLAMLLSMLVYALICDFRIRLMKIFCVEFLGEDLLPLPAVGVALILGAVFILSRQSE